MKKGTKATLKTRLNMSQSRTRWYREQRGKDNPNYKGGRYVKKATGYIYVLLQPDNPFYPMTSRHYIAEHRLIVAEALGRLLCSWEVVHHKGDKYPIGSIENKQDNRYPENLELFEEGHGHAPQFSNLQRRIKYLESILMENNIPFKGAGC